MRSGQPLRRRRGVVRRPREELVAILEKNGGHAEDAWGKGKLISEIFEAVAEEKLVQPRL